MKPNALNATLLLLCAVGMSACGRSGPVLRPDPPKVELQPLPADKMATPTFGERVRARFLQPSPTPTTPTAGSRGSSPS